MPKRAFDPIDVFVGSRVRLYRLMKSWTQTDLAGHLNLTFQQVQKYEKGTNRIGAGRLARVADLLEKPVGSFFPGERDPGTEQEVIHMVDTAQTMRLLVAFNAMESAAARAALLNLAEEMGRTHVKKQRRAA